MTKIPKANPDKVGKVLSKLEIDNRSWFEAREDGLWFIEIQKSDDGKTVQQPRRLTDEPFEIVHRLVPIDSNNQRGLMIKIGEREITVPRVNVATDAELGKWLADHGVRYDTRKKSLMSLYLSFAKPDEVRAYTRNGWQKDGAFVVGDTIIGGAEDAVALKPVVSISTFEQKGSYDEWRKKVLPLARNKPGWIFGILVGLSSPLLKRVGATTGYIFNMTGPTSIGKSDALMAAANVWGQPTAQGCLRTFDFTINAIEVLAETHSDIGLPLDEMKRGDPAVIAQTIYKIANGAGKSRMTSGVKAHRLRNWLVNVIVSGEQTIEGIFAAKETRQAGGQAVRAIDIASEGIFPKLDIKLVKAFEKALTANYGVAGRELVDRIHRMKDPDELTRKWDAATASLYDRDDQRVQRIAQGFATLIVAGQIMDIETDSVVQAFKAVVEDDVLGKTDDCVQLAKRLRAFIGGSMNSTILQIQSNEDADLVFGDDEEGVAGYSYQKREGYYSGDTVYLFPERFEKLCDGINKKLFYKWAGDRDIMEQRANRSWVHPVPGIKPPKNLLRIDWVKLQAALTDYD